MFSNLTSQLLAYCIAVNYYIEHFLFCTRTYLHCHEHYHIHFTIIINYIISTSLASELINIQV